MAARNAGFGSPTARTALRAGAIAVLPIGIGVIPFGLIYGVSAADAGLSAPLAIGMSILVFAGAAQLATVQLLTEGAAAAVIIGTGLVINARIMMYSASLEPHFRQLPRGGKAFLAYLITDQAYGVSIAHYAEDDDVPSKGWYFLGAAMSLWLIWQTTTVIGFVLGAQVPEAWSLDFAIPLVFLALVIPTIKDRSTAAAAAAGAILAVALAGAPLNLGLTLAAVSGVAVGYAVERAFA